MEIYGSGTKTTAYKYLQKHFNEIFVKRWHKYIQETLNLKNVSSCKGTNIKVKIINFKNNFMLKDKEKAEFSALFHEYLQIIFPNLMIFFSAT